MIAAFDDMQKVSGRHFTTHALKQLQWTKRIARALHKEDRRSQPAQDLIAQFRLIPHRAQRVPETNEAVDALLQRDMATDATTHAFADEDYSPRRIRPGVE